MLKYAFFMLLVSVLSASCTPPTQQTACKDMQDSCAQASALDNKELNKVCSNVESTCADAEKACETSDETCATSELYCSVYRDTDPSVARVCDGLSSSCAALEASCGSTNHSDSGTTVDGGEF
jgi:hypothetical protein